MMSTALSSHPRPLSPLLLGDAGLSISRQWILPPLFQSHSYSSKHLFVRKYSWNPLRREAAKAKVARSSLQQFPGSEDMDSFAELVSQAPTAVNGVVSRVEGLLYTIADAASVATNAATATGTETAVEKQDGGWLGGLTDALELILKVLKDGLQAVHVPYAYGFAIILLTILVKGATFPLTQKQVESTMAMKSLEPKIKAIQQQYAGNQEMIQRETASLYKQAGVNPLAGCLPTLVTLPVWIGLYRALSNVANEGLLTEGFFWIPSLAGPTTISARQNGSGISWLFPFVDGHPPLGWQDTLAYLVLPVLLVVSQYVSMQIMQPAQANDPSQKNTQAILKFLPLMIGYFSLSVPSGLGLYWLTNNILSTTQQIWFRKWGSAKPVVGKDVNVIRSAPKAEVLPSQSITDTKTARRGERFKQLKEEEARKKKEREEAARLAAAATASKAVENVVDHDRLHGIEGAKETQNASSLHGSDDEPNGDGDKTKEETSNSSTESTEPLEDIYAGNGNGATSDNQAPNTSEQSKQRGAS